MVQDRFARTGTFNSSGPVCLLRSRGRQGTGFEVGLRPLV